MKNECFVYPPKPESSDKNLSLQRRLYALEHERRFKVRELDAKKKQFIHEHCSSAPRRKGFQRPIVDTRHDITQEKLERKREEEKKSALELQSRSSSFIQELRVKPLSTLIKMERKPSAKKLEELTKTKPVETSQMSMNNKVMSLYQKGLAGVLRRDRESRINPFVQSVNKILENLKKGDANNGGKKDPMNSFTRNILYKYAGINTVDTETISEKSENVSENASTKTKSPDIDVDKNDKNDENNIETDATGGADEYLKASKHSSKGLELWARVRKEQNSISLLSKRENRDSLNVADSSAENRIGVNQVRNKSPGKQAMSLNISKTRASPTRRASSSSVQRTKSKSPTSPSIPRSPTSNGGLSPSRQSAKSEGGNRGGNKAHSTPPTNKNPLSATSTTSTTHTIKARSGGNRTREPKPVSNCKGNTTLPTVAVEDTDEHSHHTVVVVHDDHDNEPTTSLQWDQSHRYSLFDNDGLDKEEMDYLKALDKSDNSDHQDSAPEKPKTTQDTLVVNPSEGRKKTIVDDPDKDEVTNDNDNDYQETLTSERDDFQTSALSMYSESELATSTGTGTRSHSRQGGRKSRRLSVQTSGALRTLTSVLNAQSKQADRLEDDASSYTSVVNALADMACNMEEQAMKLDNFRRTGPGFAGREPHTGSTGIDREGSGPKMRRSSVGSQDRGNSSFVTNDVYKFLQRRSSSKTMPRRQTLSKLELKLLSQAPGEDVAGRRNSLSSLKSSHRSSIDFPSSNSSSVRGSVSGSLADVTSSLLDLDKQRSSRRHSMSAVSERLSTASPHSPTCLSNISENESQTGGNPSGATEQVVKTLRSYSWAPDVSEITDGHVLAMELLAKNNRSGTSRFRTVTHMLKWMGEEYRRQTASMMYEELRYCTYLRLAPHQIPATLKDTNLNGMFQSETR